MSNTVEWPPEILIPSLPNDIALQCLARVPRQYHPVLSAVSKPIRSLLSSPVFFAVRSALNCTENLLYLGIISENNGYGSWLTVYGRPNPNSTRDNDVGSNIIIAPVPAPKLPNDHLRWSHCAAVGPKIYVFGRSYGPQFDWTEVWIFDCRFHTWEQGRSMPKVRRGASKTVVLDGKIYMIGSGIEQNSWADVFDTVAGRWEALPFPWLGTNIIAGYGIRGGKVCIWTAREELRFNPAMKTWEVFNSCVGLESYWRRQMCEVNGVLYCYDNGSRTIQGYDEKNGAWKKVKLVNKGFRSHWQKLWIGGNVGGKLVIFGSAFSRNSPATKGVWCLEMAVKKDGDGNFIGEILWKEMVYSTRIYRWSTFSYNCMSVSL